MTPELRAKFEKLGPVTTLPPGLRVRDVFNLRRILEGARLRRQNHINRSNSIKSPQTQKTRRNP